jgi:hypothetical protein
MRTSVDSGTIAGSHVPVGDAFMLGEPLLARGSGGGKAVEQCARFRRASYGVPYRYG